MHLAAVYVKTLAAELWHYDRCNSDPDNATFDILKALINPHLAKLTRILRTKH